ncbi:hypothetical protein DEU56DRAFT_754132 [Suillus clintonianus]|uniref:uncharacterized protein n=1 Tax=Suillus clintonianus TaxID=1904413 RepID=UPI001B86F314|nr:uncharacterized protein DEU56DRAFT_754132 [Suillus clintonianus]KAG2145276.1 hypothetical protein DEU56DRAFT_754132 [Suillus clintonianus]
MASTRQLPEDLWDPHHAQISGAPVLFIQLKIVDYNDTGGPFELAYNFLKPYFLCGGIEYHEAFDIAATAKAVSYQQGINVMVHALKKQGKWDHVMIGISNHTDNDNGNPFAGTSSKTHLNDTYGSFAVISMLHFTCHLLLTFVEIILKWFTIVNSFPHMLGQSFKLGCHTNIFLMTPDKGQLTVTRARWTQKKIKEDLLEEINNFNNLDPELEDDLDHGSVNDIDDNHSTFTFTSVALDNKARNTGVLDPILNVPMGHGMPAPSSSGHCPASLMQKVMTGLARHEVQPVVQTESKWSMMKMQACYNLDGMIAPDQF